MGPDMPLHHVDKRIDKQRVGSRQTVDPVLDRKGLKPLLQLSWGAFLKLSTASFVFVFKEAAVLHQVGDRASEEKVGMV